MRSFLGFFFFIVLGTVNAAKCFNGTALANDNMPPNTTTECNFSQNGKCYAFLEFGSKVVEFGCGVETGDPQCGEVRKGNRKDKRGYLYCCTSDLCNTPHEMQNLPWGVLEDIEHFPAWLFDSWIRFPLFCFGIFVSLAVSGLWSGFCSIGAMVISLEQILNYHEERTEKWNERLDQQNRLQVGHIVRKSTQKNLSKVLGRHHFTENP